MLLHRPGKCWGEASELLLPGRNSNIIMNLLVQYNMISLFIISATIGFSTKVLLQTESQQFLNKDSAPNRKPANNHQLLTATFR